MFVLAADTSHPRASYTVAFKLKVIKLTGREFGDNEKLVSDWRKKKDDLMKMALESLEQ